MSRNIKARMLNFYKQWMKTRCFCPALNEDVVISYLGWNHLVGNKDNKKRPWNDVFRRLKLLPHAKAIIEQSNTVQNITEKEGNIFYILEAMRLVDTKNGKEHKKVKVVLIQLIQNGVTRKVFLSVQDRKLTGNK